MKNVNRLIFAGVVTLSFAHCVSGSEGDGRNADYFTEGQRLNYASFTTTASTFDGNIQGLVNDINALVANTEQLYAGTNATIEGIVTIPADYGIALGTTNTGCDTTDLIFQRSFVLQDGNAGILVAYGIEPPSQNSTDSTRAIYITNARNASMAIMGDRLRITVTRVQKYGSGANVTPVVTDFNVSTVSVVSQRNSIPYTMQTAAFTRAADMLKVRRLEGYVTTGPTYKECSNSEGNRRFQINYQKAYLGVICIGATSYADAQTCSGTKTPFKFQLSRNLGSGTLSGFDTDTSFSYNIPAGSKVRMTGPVFPPQFNQGDAELMMMLDQRAQAETIP